MKTKILHFLIVFILFSCKKETTSATQNWTKISKLVQYQEDEKSFHLKSGKFKYTFQKDKLPFKRIVMLNASLIGYLVELGLEDKIVAVAGAEYIYSEKIQSFIQNQKIATVGTDQKYDVEKIIALKPDVVFTNYVASFENVYDIFRKNGIEIIFLDEYLEQKPLEKTGYLTVFGKLLGAESVAKTKLLDIEKNYAELTNIALKAQKKPVVLVNEMYGNQWFMAGGKTFLAQYLKDANADYILKENQDEKSIPMSFEEVYGKAKNAEFWVNAGNHQSKKSLLQINSSYDQLPVFNQGKIFTINALQKGNANDFFERGVVRADLVLQDYIIIFHPELVPDKNLSFMKEIH